MHIEGLDELDNRIVEIIKDNARLTYSEIGAKAGVSRISVKKRMEALEKKGIIQGYKVVIDSTKIPEGVRFLLDLETTPECFEDIVGMVGEMQAYTADIQCVWRLCYPCNRICLKSQKSANFCKYIISRSEQKGYAG